jgi:hypothetical protein
MRDGGADGGVPPDDEENLAALLAVLAVLRAEGAPSEDGPIPTGPRGRSPAPAAGRSGGEALARWRARRIAVLRPPR